MADVQVKPVTIAEGKRHMGDSTSSMVAVQTVPAWKLFLQHIVDNRFTTLVMSVITVYALFGDDIRLATAPPSVDDVFFGISFVGLVMFTLELLLNSIAKPGYTLGFYFWLDLLATLSMIPDIGWLWNPLVGESDSAANGSTGAIKAGRASRAGARAGRIVRIVRLIRLIRIVKLYKHVKEGNLPSQSSVASLDDRRVSKPLVMSGTRRTSAPNPQNDSSAAVAIEEPSQVGKSLSDRTTRRVILLVLCMIIFTPLFNKDTYEEDSDSAEFGLVTVHKLSFGDSDMVFTSSLEEYVASAGSPLHLTLFNKTQDETLGLLNGVPGFDVSGYETSVDYITQNFRNAEAPLVSSSLCYTAAGNVLAGECLSYVYFDNRPDTTLEAWLNICKTFFVIIVLASAAVMFTRDAENLVIRPIERMVHIVKQLASNPLATVMDPSSCNPALDSHADNVTYETALLERTLRKVGGLLQIGFGEAGSQIIAQNMKRGGALNPMVDGVRMRGMFGFCDIRQFTDVTECLQEGVMAFVNQIGELVHGATHMYAGAANKNIGDAFLLVWRVVEASETNALANWARQQSSKRMKDLLDSSDTPEAADGASKGYTEKSAAVLPLSLVTGTSQVAPEEDVRSERSSVPLPDTGAGGTPKLRIPAPHRASLSGVASMSPGQAALRADTLCSEAQLADNALYAFLKCMVDIENANITGVLRPYQDDPKIQERFPEGFKVRLGYGLHYGWAIEGAIGSKFKIDASYLSPNVNIAARLEAATKQYGVPLLMSSEFVRRLSPAARDRCRLLDSVTVKGSKLPIQLYTFDVNHIPQLFGCQTADVLSDADFDNDPYVPMLQQGFAGAFFKHFRRAVRAYIQGNWEEAKMELQTVESIQPGDGPTATLKRVMSEHGWVSPLNWPGYRELTDK